LTEKIAPYPFSSAMEKIYSPKFISRGISCKSVDENRNFKLPFFQKSIQNESAMNFKISFLALLLFSLFIRPASALQESTPGYFMHPDVHENTVVFVAEGDIWMAPLSGGMATLLTTHPGDESDPKISPDGQWVAYAASYEGPTEVYVMPISGGLPKRLTYEPAASIPTAWKSESEVAYTSNQYSNLPRLRTVVVDMNSREKEMLPLEMAAEGSLIENPILTFLCDLLTTTM